MKNNGGFTLIELLIVIAIIGILAGTVVVSLTGETDDANDASVKLGVSSLRTPATSEGLRATAPTGNTVCNKVFTKVKGGTEDLKSWTSSAGCGAADADEENEICCASSGREWVIWGKLIDDTFFCVDDDTFSGTTTTVTTSGTDYKCGS